MLGAGDQREETVDFGRHARHIKNLLNGALETTAPDPRQIGAFLFARLIGAAFFGVGSFLLTGAGFGWPKVLAGTRPELRARPDRRHRLPHQVFQRRARDAARAIAPIVVVEALLAVWRRDDAPARV